MPTSPYMSEMSKIERCERDTFPSSDFEKKTRAVLENRNWPKLPRVVKVNKVDILEL